ncbi:MAG: FtsH protease activity modulator HflK [Burkholderiaceae bacterium]|nr:FtsH protease activity modulator HflK [Burkholderiaceae bacterium]
MWQRISSVFSLNDPGWGRGGQGGGEPPRPQRPDGNDGPPDLDELWRDFNRRLNGMFGRRGGGGSGRPPGDGGGASMRGAGLGLLLLAVVGLLLWLFSGFYIVQEGQSSIVLRFGSYQKQIDQAGFTWRLPYPIESNEIVNTQQLRTVEIGYRNSPRNKNLRESLMLTRDQSIVDIQFAMQYRVGDPKSYLFNNDLGLAPEEIVRQAGETAMREIVGRTGIDQVLYEEKDIVARNGRTLVQHILDRYGLGVTIVDVTIQQVQPPEQVQAAFEDANKAAQDRERLINEGQAYANDVIPKARGNAARLLQEAQGYQQRVIATAEGDAARFSQVLEQYSRAPKVTRERLYIDTMRDVFTNASKVYIDSRTSGNLLYLPLDRLISGASGKPAGPASSVGSAAATDSGASDGARRDVPIDSLRSTRDRDALRSRDRESFR